MAVGCCNGFQVFKMTYVRIIMCVIQNRLVADYMYKHLTISACLCIACYLGHLSSRIPASCSSMNLVKLDTCFYVGELEKLLL